jgi:hypothetical protein
VPSSVPAPLASIVGFSVTRTPPDATCDHAGVADISEWLEEHADRVSGRQRAQVETAKLLTTFATGVAAALCAAAIQVAGSSALENWSLILLASAAGLTVMTVLTDRLTEAPHKELLSQAHTQGWTNDQLLRELRTAQIDSVETNQGVVQIVRFVALVQVASAAGAGLLATLALQT